MAPLEIRHRSVRPIPAKHAQASRFLQQSPEADYAELEKHVEKLEAQIKTQGEQIDKLTADLAEASKPADAGKGATKA